MQRLLAGKFRIDFKIGEGTFSDIFCGTDIYSHQQVAVKVESAQSKSSLVMYESRVYRCLSGGVGIPKVHWYGVGEPYNILVTDLQGPTIQNLFVSMDEFGSELLLALAKEILDRIEYVHSKDFIYRDVKPENFAFGKDFELKTGLKLHIIDFGLAKRYTYPKTNQHIAMRRNAGVKGLSLFASHRARQGFEQSRRDDLEAIGNMMMYVQSRELPMNFQWMDINPGVDKLASPDLWLSQLPSAFMPYLKYTQSLRFEDKPDYNLAWELLRSASIEANQFKFVIDWTIHSIVKEDDKAHIQQPETNETP